LKGEYKMASHFSSIGLNVTSQQDFSHYFQLTYENGELINTALGKYIKWSIGNGVELWGQLDKNNSAIGLNPHFSGKSTTKVRIEYKVKSNDDTVLDGAFYCWADASEEGDDGAYPFVFDSPDMGMYENIATPQIVTAQITGFAHEVTAYENEEAFYNSRESEPKFASESFIPAGLFSPDGDDTTPPEAIAIFTGHVLETNRYTNPQTNIDFVWARVRTLGGEYDVVIDPDILNAEVIVGGIVSGMFWLSGRIIGSFSKVEKTKEKFSLKKLFGRK
jgi:hypothetical protein